jgi:protein TonB
MKGLLALALALLVNALLFWLMQQMVGSDLGDMERQRPEELVVDFVRIKQEPEPPPPDPMEELEPPPPETAPPPPKTRPVATAKPDLPLPEWEIPAIEQPLVIGKGPYLGGFRLEMPQAMPSQATPLVRVSPTYPRRALMRRIEGSVKVAFTINPDGTVSDPEVVNADPPGYFEQAALRAIRHWKFQPELEGGVAVARQAVQTILFALKDQ